jgi:imidazolonepropionase-like amidohydrolase
MDEKIRALEAGKLADLLVRDANPLEEISNIRRVRLVMRGRSLYDGAALWRAAGSERKAGP